MERLEINVDVFTRLKINKVHVCLIHQLSSRNALKALDIAQVLKYKQFTLLRSKLSVSESSYKKDFHLQNRLINNNII